MADSGLETIGRWLAAGVCAAAMTLVQAQPAHVSFRPSAGLLAINAAPRGEARAPAPAMYRTAHTAYVERGLGRAAALPRGARHSAGGRLVAKLPAGPGRAPYRAISHDARNAPPAGNAAYLRAGSIRDAVTRYNEERVTGRAAPRPPAASQRLPDPSLYRN